MRRCIVVACGVLLAVAVVNWLAVTVHMDHLRSTAAGEGGDAAFELRADAAGFHSAQAFFAVLSVACATLLVGVLGARTARWVRRRRSPRNTTCE